jgi:predicted TPR repeat methyltransferase
MRLQGMTDIDRRYEEALGHHRGGRLAEAAAIYRELLEREPDDADFLHSIGLIAAQTGRADEAEAYLEQALARNPDHPEAHNNLGNLRQVQGRLDEAVRCHQRAIELRPDNARAHSNLGFAFRKQGKFAEAEKAYRRALELDVSLVEAQRNLGRLLNSEGRLQEAESWARRVLDARPDEADAHEDLGRVLKNQQRLLEAAGCLQRALEIDPSRGPSLKHLISAYLGEKPDTAPREYIKDLFDDFADIFDEHLVTLLDYRAPRELKTILTEAVGPGRRFVRALDLGCGTGLSGVEFGAVADEIWGVDLSPQMIEKARGKGVYARLTAGGMEDFLAEVDTTFDLFVAADVFVYLGDLKSIFGRVREKAGQDALFVFSTEIATEDDYVLTPTGRFAHAEAYIEALAKQTRFAVVRCARRELRTDQGNAVVGNCFLLQAT